MAIGKDLIVLSKDMTDPYDMKGSDFKAKTPAEGSGESDGKNTLLKESPNQCGPRHTEDDGEGKPVPTDRSRVIASNFKEMKNSNEGGTSVGFGAAVDFGNGMWTGGVEYKK